MILFRARQDGQVMTVVETRLGAHDGGYWVTETDNGLKLVLTHASPDGTLTAYSHIPKDAMIVCCYPNRVRARYPHLKVVGAWNESTHWCYHEGTGDYYVYPGSKEQTVQAYLDKLDVRLGISYE